MKKKSSMKLLIVVVAFTLTAETYAQTIKLNTGLNLSNMIMPGELDLKIKPGFNVGPMAEFQISDMFSFETGLLLSAKGYKSVYDFSTGSLSYTIVNKFNLLYVDLPLSARGTINIAGTKFYGVFGPYIGMGISAKYKSKTTYSNSRVTHDEQDISFGSEEGEDHLKRLDYGLTAGAGVEFKYTQIGFSYGLGLANLAINPDNGIKIKNRVLSISVAYIFGRKIQPIYSSSF
jgi:hypothetical protein